MEENVSPRALAASVDAANVARQLLESIVLIRSHHGVGSGVVWRPNGLILTNSHVVPQAEVEVQLRSGDRLKASVVARDESLDLAALAIPSRDLPSAPVGDSSQVRVGQLVLAAGFPLGVKDVVTAGIVTSVGPVSMFRSRRPFIQSDVSLVPGNSGGPLADARGRVIGINSMVISPGLSLAIPSAEAQAFLASTFRPRAVIGVRLVEAPIGGGMVVGVESGSSAERAGIRRYDVLLAINNRKVDSLEDVASVLGSAGASPIELRILRDGQVLTIELVPDLRSAA